MRKVKMTKVPRWGIHNQIKYSPRRSLLKICPQCDKLFLQYKKGYRIYCCDVCGANARREKMKKFNENARDKRDKFKHSLQRKMDYAQGLRSERTWKPGTVIIPKPKITEGKINWKKYHNSLADEMRKVHMTSLL
jgi:hypothetical protein